uniref:Beta-hydroxyacyl-ACP dehydratase n=1 Tax=Pseudo-nitzschia australis TaxID=44445 RepID=A0A7S4EGP0_9STRA|mmetsp:Transcript_6956/g.14793  ORF Transcript_6956/g.14793 Transcript_6956/m.14793 type:complete len:213 (+) Transcript_6956:166-804(+)
MKIAALLLTTLTCVGAFTAGPTLSGQRSTVSTLFAEEAAEDADAEPEFKGGQAISALTSDVKTHFSSVDVDGILPHRYPFALIDKVVEIVPNKSAVGVKAVSRNEDFFNGHFPGQPVMPGVMQLEAMAQLAGVILNTAEGVEEGTIGFFASADGVKWKKQVVPGDLLVMEVEIKKMNLRFGIVKASGKGYTDGDLAVEVGEMTMMLAKPESK